MRGCITVLMFIAFLATPFVLLGVWTAIFVVLFIVSFALWCVGKGTTALGEHLEDKYSDEEEH